MKDPVCKCTAEALCTACKLQMLDEIHPLSKPTSKGWEKIKEQVKSLFPIRAQRDAILTKICDHYLSNCESKSGTWLMLGKIPREVLLPGTCPEAWLYKNEVTIQVANYRKFLAQHKMPYIF
jgi:hypothetical protein